MSTRVFRVSGPCLRSVDVLFTVLGSRGVFFFYPCGRFTSNPLHHSNLLHVSFQLTFLSSFKLRLLSVQVKGLREITFTVAGLLHKRSGFLFQARNHIISSFLVERVNFITVRELRSAVSRLPKSPLVIPKVGPTYAAQFSSSLPAQHAKLFLCRTLKVARTQLTSKPHEDVKR